jgi:Protein of unknown function (DUF4232)
VTKLAMVPLLALAAISASSAPAGGPVPCSARMLAARGGLQGATGALEGGVFVTNRRSYTCVLSGRPGVTFFHGGSGLRVRRVFAASTTGRRELRALVMPAGAKAYVRLRWSNWCGKRYAYVGLLLTLRVEQPRLIVDGTASTPPCLKRGAASLVAVGPWESR